MSEIDWSLAPEGATHYDTRIDVYPWLKEDDNGNKYWHHSQWVNYANDIGVNDSIFARPEAKPVYTQAMCDAGTLPLVGMKCMVESGILPLKDFYGLAVRIIGINKHSDGDNIFTFEHELQGVGCSTILAFKPITPPIELVDGKVYQFDTFDTDDDVTWVGFYRDHNDCFYDTKCFNETISESKNCTNIQLLEVKS